MQNPHHLKKRADEIHSALDPIAQRRRTTATAMARVLDHTGEEIILVASSQNTLAPFTYCGVIVTQIGNLWRLEKPRLRFQALRLNYY